MVFYQTEYRRICHIMIDCVYVNLYSTFLFMMQNFTVFFKNCMYVKVYVFDVTQLSCVCKLVV